MPIAFSFNFTNCESVGTRTLKDPVAWSWTPDAGVLHPNGAGGYSENKMEWRRRDADRFTLTIAQHERMWSSFGHPPGVLGHGRWIHLSGGAGNDLLRGDPHYLIGERDTSEGGAANDTAEGSFGDDLIHLGDGDDLGSGGSGNDLLAGGLGRDTLAGFVGDDLPSGGESDDVLQPGGNDTLADAAGRLHRVALMQGATAAAMGQGWMIG